MIAAAVVAAVFLLAVLAVIVTAVKDGFDARRRDRLIAEYRGTTKNARPAPVREPSGRYVVLSAGVARS